MAFAGSSASSGEAMAKIAVRNDQASRLCGILCVLCVRDGLEQPDDVVFEFGETAPALGQDLRRAEAQAGLVGAPDVERRIDEQSDVAESRAFAKGVDDRETIEVGEAEVQDEEARLMLMA